MINRAKGWSFSDMTDWLSRQILRPELMVFLPAVTLAAFWYGGESWLILVALGAPMLFAMAGAVQGRLEHAPPRRREETLAGDLRAQMAHRIDLGLALAMQRDQPLLVLMAQLDDLDRHGERFGPAIRNDLLMRSVERLQLALRPNDRVQALGHRLCIVPEPGGRMDLETAVQLAARLQGALDQTLIIDGISLQSSASVGFCMERPVMGSRDGKALLDAADLALDEALQTGPGGIRAFAPEMEQRRFKRSQMRDWLEQALDEGQIRPFFQPQVSTDTGDILGFEALARWMHPERGQISPAEFLPLIEEAGLSDRLGEVMVAASLRALRHWDEVALRVPSVAVNFSADELRDPRLADKLKWELDRYELEPARLTVEILENVVARNDNDVIVKNIAALSRMGCGIDLDDFGTGHASITSIRRFAVKRLKIDRSFVSRLNEDAEQQKMVAAILSMAERLGLETLAEGVETPGEHAILSQLGCLAVQGFGIGRPMPFEETIAWVERYRERIARAPKIRNRAR